MAMLRALGLAWLLLLIAALPARAGSAADEVWEAFRAAYPYHIQTVGMSPPRSDGERTLVVSEPPPHVTLASLQDLDPLLRPAAVKRHPIGVDGWVSDVVVDLPPLDDARLRQLFDTLHQHLFHTTYKAQVLVLPAAAATPGRTHGLDLAVSAADLRRWLVAEKETFRALQGGPAVNVPDLLRLRKTGLYFSARPGFVVWGIPRTGDLATATRQARQFALDSDLVLGAVADARHLLLVARERTVPVTVLPPLRTETILLLASVGSDQLAQSYERNNLFAGKLSLAFDWAPIYLSEPLVDTEYGSLLNITDQILKSWSMKGEVRYVNFAYPVPAAWPFPKPLDNELGVAEVTFNWNTKGAGYAVQATGAQWFALNRTGALPVSYLASSATVNDYEETGYAYFAKTHDPNLARVVQYAALFQSFREFGVRATLPAAPARDHPETAVLAGEGLRVLELAADEARVDALLARLAMGEDERVKARAQARRLREALGAVVADFGDEGRQAVARHLANPRLPSEAPVRRPTSAPEFRAMLGGLSRPALRDLLAEVVAGHLQREPLRSVLQEPVDTDDVLRRYAAAARGRTSGWIRTPSVVLSVNTSRPMTVTGGHNLDARSVHYRVSPDVAEGRVKAVTEEGRLVILHNERDLGKLPSLLRPAAIEAGDPRLATTLERRLASATVTTHPRAVGLLVDERPRAVRGLAPEPDGPHLGAGWRVAPAPPGGGNPAARLGRLGAPSLTVERKADGTFVVFHDGLDQPLEAGSFASLVDLAESAMRDRANPRQLFQLHLSGLTEDEATGFLRTMETKLAGPDRPSVAGFTYGKDVTPDRAFRELATHYDFARARVVEREIAPAAEAARPGLQELRFSVEIPAVQPATPSLLLRIRMFLSRTVLAPAREALQKLVRDALAGPGVQNANIAILRIQKRLKALHPGADVRIKYEREAVDIYITKAEPDGSDHAPDRRAA